MATVGTATCPETGKLVLVIRFDNASELHSLRAVSRCNSDGAGSHCYQNLVRINGWKEDYEKDPSAIEEVMSKILKALLVYK